MYKGYQNKPLANNCFINAVLQVVIRGSFDIGPVSSTSVSKGHSGVENSPQSSWVLRLSLDAENSTDSDDCACILCSLKVIKMCHSITIPDN
ncbi:uncharacterized protein [Blastocystis hominis]|uniref:Uncharacterized protein n=1 Tax=Blastocystis hominis TaxID=12968 RepID=D8MAL1_BLAHO|nr:uncharacterized protein [Blastocystis hominis]CBK25100.2 unnamed protein product [Blastocystis hominis]|eukprot:XP_012899148.1 uncharacterized protein [Blastocystis hominis]